MRQRRSVSDHSLKIKPMEQFLERVTYPVTVVELVEVYGEYELDRDGAPPVRVADLLADVDNRAYLFKDDLRQELLDFRCSSSGNH